MEWVETTGKTIDAAREAALDQLGVAADEAEFDVIEEPRPGLFGRVRGEARLRARVRPTQVRPKQERKRRGRSDGAAASSAKASTNNDNESASDDAVTAATTPDCYDGVSRQLDVAAACASAHHHQQAQRGAHDDQ